VIDHAEQIPVALAVVISSIPIRRNPASRSVRPASAATTRTTIADTDRQVTR
jgi:hypothetical protein